MPVLGDLRRQPQQCFPIPARVRGNAPHAALLKELPVVVHFRVRSHEDACQRRHEYTGPVGAAELAFDALVHLDEASPWSERWARSVAERTSYGSEARIRRRDGE